MFRKHPEALPELPSASQGVQHAPDAAQSLPKTSSKHPETPPRTSQNHATDRFRLTFKAPGASTTKVLLKEFKDSHFFVVAAPSAFSLLRKALRRAPLRSKMQPQTFSRVPQELPEAFLRRTWSAQRRLPSHLSPPKSTFGAT